MFVNTDKKSFVSGGFQHPSVVSLLKNIKNDLEEQEQSFYFHLLSVTVDLRSRKVGLILSLFMLQMH